MFLDLLKIPILLHFLRLERNKCQKQIFLHFHVIELDIFHATLNLSLEDLRKIAS